MVSGKGSDKQDQLEEPGLLEEGKENANTGRASEARRADGCPGPFPMGAQGQVEQPAYGGHRGE